MTDKELHQLKFPIGEWQLPTEYSDVIITSWIYEIEMFPGRLKALVSGLNNSQLNWVYRTDGWSIKQVVHHCSDSHMNSIIRFKLTLTEDLPVIKPNNESKWAMLVDGNTDDVSDSLMFLESVSC